MSMCIEEEWKVRSHVPGRAFSVRALTAVLRPSGPPAGRHRHRRRTRHLLTAL